MPRHRVGDIQTRDGRWVFRPVSEVRRGTNPSGISKSTLGDMTSEITSQSKPGFLYVFSARCWHLRCFRPCAMRLQPNLLLGRSQEQPTDPHFQDRPSRVCPAPCADRTCNAASPSIVTSSGVWLRPNSVCSMNLTCSLVLSSLRARDLFRKGLFQELTFWQTAD